MSKRSRLVSKSHFLFQQGLFLQNTHVCLSRGTSFLASQFTIVSLDLYGVIALYI